MSELDVGLILAQAQEAFELAKNGEDESLTASMRRLDLSYLNVHVQFSLGLTRAASTLGQSKEYAIWTHEDGRNTLLDKMDKVIKESSESVVNFNTSFRDIEILGNLVADDVNPKAIIPVIAAWFALDDAFVAAGGKSNVEIREKLQKISSGGAVG